MNHSDPRGWQKAALSMHTTGRFPPKEWIRPNDADLAWCAGLFEGEGCVVYGANHNGPFTVKIGMSDHDVLILMGKRSGLGHISGPHEPSGVGKKVWYLWKANGREAILLADAMFLWLGTRRKNQLTEKMELWLSRPKRKVSEDNLEDILRRREKGETYKSIGEAYGVGWARIWQFVNAPKGIAS